MAVRRDLAMAVTGGWYGAAFQRNKRLPDLNKVLRRIAGEPRKTQTPEEALRIAVILNAQMGGKDNRKVRT